MLDDDWPSSSLPCSFTNRPLPAPRLRQRRPPLHCRPSVMKALPSRWFSRRPRPHTPQLPPPHGPAAAASSPPLSPTLPPAPLLSSMTSTCAAPRPRLAPRCAGGWGLHGGACAGLLHGQRKRLPAALRQHHPKPIQTPNAFPPHRRARPIIISGCVPPWPLAPPRPARRSSRRPACQPSTTLTSRALVTRCVCSRGEGPAALLISTM